MEGKITFMYLLNKSFDKIYARSVYESLKLEEKRGILSYEPVYKKRIFVDKKGILLDCWRTYFKVLYPIYYPKYKKSAIFIINVIFANELSYVENCFYQDYINVTVAFKELKEGLIKYKKNTDIELYG